MQLFNKCLDIDFKYQEKHGKEYRVIFMFNPVTKVSEYSITYWLDNFSEIPCINFLDLPLNDFIDILKKNLGNKPNYSLEGVTVYIDFDKCFQEYLKKVKKVKTKNITAEKMIQLVEFINDEFNNNLNDFNSCMNTDFKLKDIPVPVED